MHNYKITFLSNAVFHEGNLIVNFQADSEDMALSMFIDTYGNFEPHSVSIMRQITDEELMSI